MPRCPLKLRSGQSRKTQSLFQIQLFREHAKGMLFTLRNQTYMTNDTGTYAYDFPPVLQNLRIGSPSQPQKARAADTETWIGDSGTRVRLIRQDQPCVTFSTPKHIVHVRHPFHSHTFTQSGFSCCVGIRCLCHVTNPSFTGSGGAIRGKIAAGNICISLFWLPVRAGVSGG